MSVDDRRRAVFATQAQARFDHAEAEFRPVIRQALRQLLGHFRSKVGAHLHIRLTADASPNPAREFTKADAQRIYTLMISDPKRWHQILDDLVMPAYTAMLGPALAAALNDPRTANAIQAWRSAWIADRRQLLVGVPDVVAAQFRTAMDDLAAKVGTNVDDVASLAQKMLDDGYPSWAGRADLIARTETISANNQGALASWSAMADAAQVTATKTWLATPDAKTRPSHLAANGQTVGMSENFTVGDSEMNGPGDPSADASEICNCRCTLTYDIPEQASPEQQTEAADLEDQLAASAWPGRHPVAYYAVDVAGDTAPVADTSAPTGVAIMAMLSAADAATLAQPGGEAPEELHCTLGYLAKDAAEYSDDVKASLTEALASAWIGPVPAKAFATAVFNADDPEREPCSVLLVQSDELAAAHQGVADALGGLASTTFPIWIPHTALAYNAATPLPPELAAGQTITYDRLVMAWGAEQIDLTEKSLTAATEAPVTAPAPADTTPAAPAADAPAAGGDTAIEAPAIDLTPKGIPWSGPIAMLNTPSSDGRMIRAGGATIRPLPLPLSWQKESGYGHEDSVIIGRILAVEDRGDVLWGSGDYLDPMMNFDAEQAMAQVDSGLGLISVDISPITITFVDAAGQPVDPLLDPDMGGPDAVLVAEEYEFCGATIVSIPAFADARITNGEPPASEGDKGVGQILMPVGEFAAANPEAPVLSDDGTTITLNDGSTVGVGDTVGLGDTDSDGNDDQGTITAIDATEETITAQVLPDGDDDADDDPANPQTVTVPIANLAPPAPQSTEKPGSTTLPPAPALVAAAGVELELVASAAGWTPKAGSFAKRDLDGPTPMTINRETREVFGHVHHLGQCHLGKLAQTGACVNPPETHIGYAGFHLGNVNTTDGPLPVGQITMDAGHARDGIGMQAALSHYDNSATAIAAVRAHKDEYGTQYTGEIVPWATDEQIDRLELIGQVSGDWREIDGQLELIAALAVPRPSFPQRRETAPRVGFRHGRQVSLVAAAIVYPDEPEAGADVVLPSGSRIARGDFEMLVASFAAAIEKGDPAKVRIEPFGTAEEFALEEAHLRLRLATL